MANFVTIFVQVWLHTKLNKKINEFEDLNNSILLLTTVGRTPDRKFKAPGNCREIQIVKLRPNDAILSTFFIQNLKSTKIFAKFRFFTGKWYSLCYDRNKKLVSAIAIYMACFTISIKREYVKQCSTLFVGFITYHTF